MSLMVVGGRHSIHFSNDNFVMSYITKNILGFMGIKINLFSAVQSYVYSIDRSRYFCGYFSVEFVCKHVKIFRCDIPPENFRNNWSVTVNILLENRSLWNCVFDLLREIGWWYKECDLIFLYSSPEPNLAFG